MLHSCFFQSISLRSSGFSQRCFNNAPQNTQTKEDLQSILTMKRKSQIFSYANKVDEATAYVVFFHTVRHVDQELCDLHTLTRVLHV